MYENSFDHSACTGIAAVAHCDQGEGGLDPAKSTRMVLWPGPLTVLGLPSQTPQPTLQAPSAQNVGAFLPAF